MCKDFVIFEKPCCATEKYFACNLSLFTLLSWDIMSPSATGIIRKFIVSHQSRRKLSTSAPRSSSTSPQRRAAAAAAAPKRDCRHNVRPFSDIPGPIALPMLRHSAHVLPRIGNFHHTVGLGVLDGLHARYGDLVRLAQGTRSRPVLYVFHPELMREVYESNATEPPRWEKSPLGEQRASGGHGCPMHADESKAIWAAFRALLNDKKLLNNYDEAFDEIAADATRRLGSLRGKGTALNDCLESELYRWALEALGVVVLGTRLGCLDGPVKIEHDDNPSLGDELISSCMKISRAEYLVRSEHTLRTGKGRAEALQAFDRHYSLIESFLSQALKELHGGGGARPERALLDKLRRLQRRLLPVAADFTLAGLDPLVQSSVGLLRALSLQAARQQRAAGEAAWRRAAAQHGDCVGAAQLPYTRACVVESLRLGAAVGGVVRRARDPLLLHNYEVPAGVDIVLGHSVSSKCERDWGRADSFIPERWLNEAGQPLRSSRAHPYSCLPFGQSCPAEDLSINMLTSLASSLLEQFRVEWHGPPPKMVTAAVNKLETPYHFVLQDAA